MDSYTKPHKVSSVYLPDNCCYRRIPLRVSVPLSYPYDLGHMLVACPLKPVWSSPADHLSVDEKRCSSSTVSPWPSGNSFKSVS